MGYKPLKIRGEFEDIDGWHPGFTPWCDDWGFQPPWYSYCFVVAIVLKKSPKIMTETIPYKSQMFPVKKTSPYVDAKWPLRTGCFFVSGRPSRATAALATAGSRLRFVWKHDCGNFPKAPDISLVNQLESPKNQKTWLAHSYIYTLWLFNIAIAMIFMFWIQKSESLRWMLVEIPKIQVRRRHRAGRRRRRQRRPTIRESWQNTVDFMVSMGSSWFWLIGLCVYIYIYIYYTIW